MSIFWLAIASPIIRPTLPSNPQNLFFCIFAGIAIADAAAHAISDIAGIWKPHDLGLAQAPRRKFSARKLFFADVRGLLTHLTALPIIAMMSYSYQLLSPAIEAKLFGPEAAHGVPFWNFVSQSVMGGTDVFGFFLSQDTKAAIQRDLHLVVGRRQITARRQHHGAIAHRLDQLTQREREVMKLVVAGKLNKQVADELNISMKTVEAHRARVMEKMGVRTLAELVKAVMTVN